MSTGLFILLRSVEVINTPFDGVIVVAFFAIDCLWLVLSQAGR